MGLLHVRMHKFTVSVYQRYQQRSKLIVVLWAYAVVFFHSFAALNDFESSDVQVTIPSNMRSAQVTIPIKDDNVAEITELFNAILVNPSSNAEVGTRNSANIEINDDDGRFNWTQHLVYCSSCLHAKPEV